MKDSKDLHEWSDIRRQVDEIRRLLLNGEPAIAKRLCESLLARARFCAPVRLARAFCVLYEEAEHPDDPDDMYQEFALAHEIESAGGDAANQFIRHVHAYDDESERALSLLEDVLQRREAQLIELYGLHLEILDYLKKTAEIHVVGPKYASRFPEAVELREAAELAKQGRLLADGPFQDPTKLPPE